MVNSQISERRVRRALAGTVAAICFACIGLHPAPLLAAGDSPNIDVCHDQPATDSAALAVESAWATAARAHDIASLSCIIDSSFVDTDWRGALRTRAAVLGGPPAAPSAYHQSFGDFTTQRIGDIVIIRGMNTVSDSSGRALQHVRFTDVLRYTSRRWRAVSAQETLVREEQQG